MYADPKITFAPGTPWDAGLVRQARILVERRLREDAAGGLSTSSVRYKIGSAVCTVTHEFSQTYAHISNSQPKNPSASRLIPVRANFLAFVWDSFDSPYPTLGWESPNGVSWTPLSLSPFMVSLLRADNWSACTLPAGQLFVVGQPLTPSGTVQWALGNGRVFGVGSPSTLPGPVPGASTLDYWLGPSYVGGTAVFLAVGTTAGPYFGVFDYVNRGWVTAWPLSIIFGGNNPTLNQELFAQVNFDAIPRSNEYRYSHIYIAAGASSSANVYILDPNQQSLTELFSLSANGVDGSWAPQVVCGATGSALFGVSANTTAAPAQWQYYYGANPQVAPSAAFSFPNAINGLGYQGTLWFGSAGGSASTTLVFLDQSGVRFSVAPAAPGLFLLDPLPTPLGMYNIWSGDFYGAPGTAPARLGVPPFAQYPLTSPTNYGARGLYVGQNQAPWMNLGL